MEVGAMEAAIVAVYIAGTVMGTEQPVVKVEATALGAARNAHGEAASVVIAEAAATRRSQALHRVFLLVGAAPKHRHRDCAQDHHGGSSDVLPAGGKEEAMPPAAVGTAA